MNLTRMQRFLGVCLLCGVTAAIVAATAPPKSSGRLDVQLHPFQPWRLGFYHVDVCASANPMEVGWRARVGPLSVARLTPWRFETPSSGASGPSTIQFFAQPIQYVPAGATNPAIVQIVRP